MATSKDEFDIGDRAVSQVLIEVVHLALQQFAIRYPPLCPVSVEVFSGIQFCFGTVPKNPLVTMASQWCGIVGRVVVHLDAGSIPAVPMLCGQERFWMGSDESAAVRSSGLFS